VHGFFCDAAGAGCVVCGAEDHAPHECPAATAIFGPAAAGSAAAASPGGLLPAFRRRVLPAAGPAPAPPPGARAASHAELLRERGDALADATLRRWATTVPTAAEVEQYGCGPAGAPAWGGAGGGDRR